MEQIRQTAKRLFARLREAEERHQLEKDAFEVTPAATAPVWFWFGAFGPLGGSEELHGHESGLIGLVWLLLVEQQTLRAPLEPPGEPSRPLAGAPGGFGS